jgi:sugar fermentation stimulation protein A
MLSYSAPLVEARFLRRYKRFLVDIELEGGAVITAHCANTGSMRACLESGAPCRLSFHDNPKRKLQWSLEQIYVAGQWIMVNTAKPNHVVEAAIRADRIPELAGYTIIERERKVGQSRLDLRLSGPSAEAPVAWVEVKNVTMRAEKIARFPDAVTKRGTKHLHELIEILGTGERAVLFFHVGTTGVVEVRPADAIDPEYGGALRRAARAGVEILAYACDMSEEGLWLTRRLPVVL